MTPLAQVLAARIRAHGPMSLADYMAECLLHPAHGYYTTQNPFGAQGDFILAPTSMGNLDQSVNLLDLRSALADAGP